MMKPRFLLAGLMLGNWLMSSVVAQDEPVLDELIMTLSVESARLSALAYENATAYATGVDENNVTLYEHPDYESISFYTDEPDQAVVAKKDGRCYLSFRGTTLSITDWFQNIGLGSIDIHKDNDMNAESCNARGGYADFLLSPLVQQGAVQLQECASSCSDPDDCVILTGHSQGGAVSTLAAILLYSYNPILVTFGGPLAVSRNCDLIRSERSYRYVNSVVGEPDEAGEEPSIDYDPVPLLPAAGQGRGHYGYYLLLGDDTTALKFLGVDGDDSGFAPGPQLSAVPHTMGGTDRSFSYEARITSLFDNGVFPVVIKGFSGGVPCDVENSLTCASDECPSLEAGCTAGPIPAPTTATGPTATTPAPTTATGPTATTPAPTTATGPTATTPAPTTATGPTATTPAPTTATGPTMTSSAIGVDTMMAPFLTLLFAFGCYL